MLDKIFLKLERFVPVKYRWILNHDGFKRYFANTDWMFFKKLINPKSIVVVIKRKILGASDYINNKLKTPEGTYAFVYNSEDLLNINIKVGIIFEKTAGSHIFRLERTDDFYLKFYYASPGTGTRVASIDLSQSALCTKASIILTWSPEEITLSFGPLTMGGKLLSERGGKCEFQLRVGTDGSIIRVGDSSVETMGEICIKDEQEILSSTAINSWEDIKKALEILKTGKSDSGYIYEVVVANVIISFLVTGFETYIKKRILELEGEGISPNLKAYFSMSNKDRKLYKLLKKESKIRSVSLLDCIIQKRKINFQDYDNCKRFFDKVFGIKFYSMGVNSGDIGLLKEFISFRHRIIHVSPLGNIINLTNASSQEPHFSDYTSAEQAIGLFDMFINKLHQETLKKRV